VTSTFSTRLTLFLATVMVSCGGEYAIGGPHQKRPQIRELQLGEEHSCAVTQDGKAWCWGRNDTEQIDPTRATYLTPVLVAGQTQIEEFSLRAHHTCVRRSDGSVGCWGANADGQVGAGTVSDAASAEILVPQGITQIAAGTHHSCALSNGAPWCWGNNATGALGDGTTVQRLSPTPTIGLRDVGEISLGRTFSCALGVAKNVMCWGTNSRGQVGDGTIENRLQPTPVLNVPPPVAEVRLGDDHACARTEGGDVYCWGRNLEAECGDLSGVNQPLPVRVSLPVRAQALFVGHRHACVLSPGNQSYCWGDGSGGQLGPTVSSFSPPFEFKAVTGVDQFALGDDHSCALTSDHQVWCWGRNQYGQLGDGTTTDNAVPRRVTF
jgi:alpha-tubulin suppressor-like RCC1 family protein